ncbi:hypothetical protein [Flavicella sediminum]|uniref:hypothetical protein n=1 Tax=Flavicella sediminum TaxID=2585141 RepID=UPI00111E24B5|nr:hypothetical protein [Flavicella sediminum]
MKIKHFLITLFIAAFANTATAQKSLSSLDSLIYKKRAYNKSIKSGFCIQLYNGNEEMAIDKLAKFQKNFPDIKIFRTYKVPEWKIQTEVYRTRLEADRVLNLIQKKYPGARVL